MEVKKAVFKNVASFYVSAEVSAATPQKLGHRGPFFPLATPYVDRGSGKENFYSMKDTR